jgi:hypothetical protein
MQFLSPVVAVEVTHQVVVEVQEDYERLLHNLFLRPDIQSLSVQVVLVD